MVVNVFVWVVDSTKSTIRVHPRVILAMSVNIVEHIVQAVEKKERVSASFVEIFKVCGQIGG